MRLEVKICGISTPDALEAAIRHGARAVGFVFYPPSPRHVSPDLAAELARAVPTGVRVVGLFVSPEDEDLEATLKRVPVDIVQLHGKETPERVAAVRALTATPVMKALPIGTEEDVEAATAYAAVADRLLFDARPPKTVSALPGGNGLAFDWTLLAGREWRKPWMLSGGLTADNLAEAVSISGAAAVDVSSGVESRPGHKDVRLIGEFLDRAGTL